MTSKKFLRIAGLSAFAVGCSAAQDNTKYVSEKMSLPSAEKHQAPHTPHTKLSAAVDFNTDFSGRADIGVVETLNINVTSHYPGSRVSFELLDAPGLQIFQKSGLTETTASLGEGGHDLSLQFQPVTEGVHDIIILAKVTLADGQYMTKTHLIPVYVGDQFQPSKEVKTLEPSTTSQELGGMIIMDAEETIE